MHHGIFEGPRTVVLFCTIFIARCDARLINPETGEPLGPPQGEATQSLAKLEAGPALQEGPIDYAGGDGVVGSGENSIAADNIIAAPTLAVAGQEIGATDLPPEIARPAPPASPLGFLVPRPGLGGLRALGTAVAGPVPEATSLLRDPGAPGNTAHLAGSEAARPLQTRALAVLELAQHVCHVRNAGPPGEPARPRPSRARTWRTAPSLPNALAAVRAAHALATALAEAPIPEADRALAGVEAAARAIADPAFPDIEDPRARRRVGPRGPGRSAPSCWPAPHAPASSACASASRPAMCPVGPRDGRAAR